MSKTRTLIYVVVASVISLFLGGVVGRQLIKPYESVSYKIDGPITANVGDILEYNISTYNLSVWAKPPIWQWKVVDDAVSDVNFKLASPTNAFFGASAGTTKYYIICSGSVYYNYLVWGYEVPLGVSVKAVEINNPSPPVPPGPNPVPPSPNPIPTPSIPVGKFNIAQPAYDLAVAINSPLRGQLFQKIQTNYVGVASSISAGALTTLPDVMNTIATNNTNTVKGLGFPIDQWSTWSLGMKTKMYAIYTAKQLNTLKDYADLFNEIATGLSYVK